MAVFNCCPGPLQFLPCAFPDVSEGCVLRLPGGRLWTGLVLERLDTGHHPPGKPLSVHFTAGGGDGIMGIITSLDS